MSPRSDPFVHVLPPSFVARGAQHCLTRVRAGLYQPSRSACPRAPLIGANPSRWSFDGQGRGELHRCKFVSAADKAASRPERLALVRWLTPPKTSSRRRLSITCVRCPAVPPQLLRRRHVQRALSRSCALWRMRALECIAPEQGRCGRSELALSLCTAAPASTLAFIGVSALCARGLRRHATEWTLRCSGGCDSIQERPFAAQVLTKFHHLLASGPRPPAPLVFKTL